METARDLDDRISIIKRAGLETSFENDVAEFLSEIDSKYEITDPQWEYYHGRLAAEASRKVMEMEDWLNQETVDVTTLTVTEDQLRFQLYFTIVKVHIQKENHGDLRRLANEFEDQFDDHDLSTHLSAQSQKVWKGVGSEDVLNLAYAATNVFETHPSAQHHLGKIIVERIESGFTKIDNANFPDTEKEILEFAEDYIKDAIEYESSYATYHATSGRVLYIQGRYSAARRSIERAIELEDRDKFNGPIRISEYHRYLTRVDILEQQEEFKETKLMIREAEKQVQEFQTRTLEFLGFFAALLTVAVTSVTIATGFPFSDAARLILILIGGTLIAFSGLGAILPRRPEEDYGKETFFVILVGTALMLLGLFAPALIQPIT